MTMTRSGTPTWLAARPTPGAARIVSIMSSISFWMDASIFRTLFAFWRSTGSPATLIGSTATHALLRAETFVRATA